MGEYKNLQLKTVSSVGAWSKDSGSDPGRLEQSESEGWDPDHASLCSATGPATAPPTEFVQSAVKCSASAQDRGEETGAGRRRSEP